MITVHATPRPVGDAARGARIFRGELIVFRSLGAVADLVASADAMVRAAFAPHHPLTAHAVLDPDGYAEAANVLIDAFARDAEIGALYRAALSAAGVDPGRVYWDCPRLRIQPPGERHTGRRVMNLPPHRDSWGSNLPAQINWWAPIYPVSAGRTMVVYPAHWRTPIANSSAGWDYDALRARRRRGDDSYPLLPVATGAVDTAGAWPAVIDPGDLLCFSGTHLHASAPNATGVARFSTEVRTVCLDDLRAGRAAPDIDGAAPRRPLGWFKRIADGALLADAWGGPTNQ